MTAPMEAPPLKTAIPMARSFCGNHSAIDLCGARPVACFAEAEEEGAGGKAGKARNGRVRHGGGTPDDDGDGEAEARAVTIVEAAGDALAQGIGEE